MKDKITGILTSAGVDPSVINEVISSIDVTSLVQDGVAASLKDIKAKLDAAYSERDTIRTELAAIKQANQDAEIERLKQQGKLEEALQAQLANAAAANEALAKENTELARNAALRAELSAVTFNSDSAANMAFKEIVASLTKSADGIWRTADGMSMAEYTKVFLADPANAFLLKAKQSSGFPDGVAATPPARSDKPQTQADILAGIANGTIKRTR